MAPTVRIDDEVYQWLKDQAVPFDDTPNTVLRRIAQLDDATSREPEEKNSNSRQSAVIPIKSLSGKRPPLVRGDDLIGRWRLPVKQARFHRDGHYYQHLTQFPSALCDMRGYVIFQDKVDYENCANLLHGQQLNVKQPGISAISGYARSLSPIKDN